MLLSLWDIGKLGQSFMDLYELSTTQYSNILGRMKLWEQDPVSAFCEETGVRLDELDVISDLEFVGKLVSTTNDDFIYLRQHGLLPVDNLLESDSPLSRHLNKYQIEIRPSAHEFSYKGQRFYIPSYDKETNCMNNCKWCAYGDSQCRYEKERYRDMCCPYLKSIHSLSIKLYSDKSEIEFYLVSNKDDMINYSCVSRYPEIFETIEELIDNCFHVKLNIGIDWCKTKQSSYILTFAVKYNETSYKGNYIEKHDPDAMDLLCEYGKYCNQTYDFPEITPRCFWDNIWLINTCLNLIASGCESTCSIYAGLKHEIRIPFDRLKIELV